MKTWWWISLFLAICLPLDGALAICQYPSLLGSTHILELSLIEIQIGLIFAILTSVRARDGHASRRFVICALLASYVVMSFAMQRRQRELERLGELAVESLIDTSHASMKESCHIVGHRRVFFLERLEFTLHCPSNSRIVTVYFDHGKVSETSID
ncbi:MAG: hypothetical protein ACJ8G1_20790 [Vitreoscilla sp.]